jgi:broad specificity phosphatase PhoE
MQLYIVRHPETEWNKEGRFQGQTDIPISTEGYEDLQRTLPLLSSLPVDIIYTSPLKRAKSVAQEVSRVTELPYFEDARIMEVNCGIWEGRTIDYFSKKEPSLF